MAFFPPCFISGRTRKMTRFRGSGSYSPLYNTGAASAVRQGLSRLGNYRFFRRLVALLLVSAVGLYVAKYLLYENLAVASQVGADDTHSLDTVPVAATDIPLDDHASTALDPADAALSQLCGQTRWTDGLWLHCHSGCGPEETSICGGLNNARNRLQTCVRLAISIGAGVAVPHVTTRSETSLNLLDTGVVCPEAWFDMDRLSSELTRLCPGMKVRSCDVRAASGTVVVHLPDRDYKDRPHFNNTFQQVVESHLGEQGHDLSTINADRPVRLMYQDAHLAWCYRESGELSTIRKALFRALTYNQTLLDISDALANSPALRDGYFAVHLRGESDWPAYWGTPDVQMKLQRDAIERVNAAAKEPVKTVYVSTGERHVFQTFKEMLEVRNYTVHDKWSLLADRPDESAILERLLWDQKGVAEYNVMVRAKYWSGVFVSTLSAMVAYHRVMDDVDEFWSTYIYPGSAKWGLQRTYSESVVIRGNGQTMGFVVDGQEIMDAFP